MAIGHKVNGSLSYHLVPFRQCTQNDYQNITNDTIENPTELKQRESRLCPDTEKLKDIWNVKGDYSNVADRIHFHIEINMCN